MSVINFYPKSLLSVSKLIKINILKDVRSYCKKCKNSKCLKVTVCGAGGNVGQSLSLILKQSSLIDELALYDTAAICGFGMELGHIDTKCKVTAYSGIDAIRPALEGAKVVVVTAAPPKVSFRAYSAMFEPNANAVLEIAENISFHCPQALIAIASDPINSLVPLASEVLKLNGAYDPKKVFGITALDVVRTNSFVAEVQGLDPESVMVPVIGGHADKTIVPVLSQAKPCADFTIEELETITKKVQTARHDIIKIKNNQSSILSTAFATARFVLSLVKALRGQNNIIECAYVRSSVHPHAKYLSTPLLLGPKGILRNYGIPKLSEYENCQLENAIPLLTADIKKGERFVGVEDPPPCDPCDPSPSAGPCPPNFCK